ncbi:MAG: hypothetical protein JXB15_09385 [Anaerolineales bacterium]|nr:hypothetical protein [Anaerolineales bacterium]
MEGKLQLMIRTATRDRQATIAAPPDATIGEILASARENWNLSGNYEYVMRCERLGAQLLETQTLQQAGVLENDILEIQPLADAG